MSAVPEQKPPENGAPPPPGPRRDTATLTTVALCLVIAAASWFLLRELAGLLRPLLLAIFLGYVILPAHLRLRQRVPAPASVLALAGATVGLLYLLTLLIYGSVVELNEELPRLVERARDVARQVKSYGDAHLPWLAGLAEGPAGGEVPGTGPLRDFAAGLVNAAFGALADAVVVGFYLIFLLIEAGRFPGRVRGAFATERADQILAVIDSINGAMASYLRVKVKASLILAVPITLVFWAFGVKFAVLVGVVTFLCNFIPYLGSLISVSLALLLTFLLLAPGWQPFAVAGLVLASHLLSAYVVEPTMTGRAVGLRPIVILVALAFWGQCWGLVGMFLAVPLTVMVKIVLENVAFTRPIARLLGDE